MDIRGEMRFQRESEFGLASTTQLIYLWKDINKDSEIAESFADRMAFTISIRPDYQEASEKVRRGEL